MTSNDLLGQSRIILYVAKGYMSLDTNKLHPLLLLLRSELNLKFRPHVSSNDLWGQNPQMSIDLI